MNNVEMIEQLMKDYIEEMKKPKNIDWSAVNWKGYSGKKERKNSKLRRIRLMLQEKMLNLEREN